MPAKNSYHHAVKQRLANTDWNITQDPYQLKWAGWTFSIDLGAEPLLATQQADSKIAIEVKNLT